MGIKISELIFFNFNYVSNHWNISKKNDNKLGEFVSRPNKIAKSKIQRKFLSCRICDHNLTDWLQLKVLQNNATSSTWITYHFTVMFHKKIHINKIVLQQHRIQRLEITSGASRLTQDWPLSSLKQYSSHNSIILSTTLRNNCFWQS